LEKKEEKKKRKERKHRWNRAQRDDVDAGSIPHKTALLEREEGGLGVNINTGSAVIAQQVIMITTCSLGSFSLI